MGRCNKTNCVYYSDSPKDYHCERALRLKRSRTKSIMDALGLTQSTKELDEILDPSLCPLHETKSRPLTEARLQRRLEVARELIAKRKAEEATRVERLRREAAGQNQSSLQDTFLALYDQGYTDLEIAQACGCGTQAVRRWRGEEELSRNTFGKSQRIILAKIRELAPHMTLGQIASQLGLSRSTVRCYRAREGIKAHRGVRSAAESRAEVERLILAGCTRAEMAQVLGLKATTVLDYARDVMYRQFYYQLSDQIKEIKKLYAKGCTASEIDQACGCDVKAVTIWCWYESNKRRAEDEKL